FRAAATSTSERSPGGSATPARGSHVNAGRQRILLDELAARLHHVAHQLGEDIVGVVGLLDLHLQERSSVGVERGLPQLAGIQLAEALVTLQGDVLAAYGGHGLDQADRAVDRSFLALAAQGADTRIIFLERLRVLVEPASVGGAEQRVVDHGDFAYA